MLQKATSTLLSCSADRHGSRAFKLSQRHRNGPAFTAGCSGAHLLKNLVGRRPIEFERFPTIPASREVQQSKPICDLAVLPSLLIPCSEAVSGSRNSSKKAVCGRMARRPTREASLPLDIR